MFRKFELLKNRSWEDILYDLVCNVCLIFLVTIMLYPIYFVFVASFTAPMYVNSGDLLLYPKELFLDGYKLTFADKRIWIGYGNTIFYTVCSSVLGVLFTTMAGYALSKNDLPGRNIVMRLFVFTMYFGGGTIPSFLLIESLGLLNTRGLIVLLSIVSVYNMIIVRSFMQSNIPAELCDAAYIDGCGEGYFFFKIVMPLSKAVMAVIVLYIAVSVWNSYFSAMMYLTDQNKQPLQLYLKQVLLSANSYSYSMENLASLDAESQKAMQQLTSVIKYSVIVVSTAPILCIYPFIQKYFVKGVMIGSIKG